MNGVLAARAALIAGTLRGDELGRCIAMVPSHEREAWVDALLALPIAPPDEPLPRGAVPYLPAGIDEILTALRGAAVGPSDLFVDIGSGLGRVVLLAHLLTGAKAHGIELQAGLVRSARRTAAELGLSAVSFERADASDVALDGSVFFLYSPMTGEALRRVLVSLQNVAEKRPIVVCSIGLRLDQASWLEGRPDSSAAVSVYDAGPRRR